MIHYQLGLRLVASMTPAQAVPCVATINTVEPTGLPAQSADIVQQQQ